MVWSIPLPNERGIKMDTTESGTTNYGV
jgi:hypothetical protein